MPDRLNSQLSPALPMSSVFPLEIYEHILDFVADYRRFKYTKRTLLSTSLVCHSLYPRSRVLVFRTLRFIEADVAALIRYRCHLFIAPHLAAYVEEVRLTHRGEYSNLLELFPSCLATHLPRLRRVFVNTSHSTPLTMHRFFCLPGIRVPTVTALEYEDIGLPNTAELDGLILPYPNVQVLTLHRVWWVDLTEEFGDKGLPRPLKAPLAKLTELRLTHFGDGANIIHLVNRLGYEQLLETCRGTLSRLLLNIIPIRVLVLQFKEDYPLGIIEFPRLDILHLEIFTRPENETEVYDTYDADVVPYTEIISVIPRLLYRLAAVRLHTLDLHFAFPDVNQSPDAFLGHLATIRKPIEEIVLGSRFPNLKHIIFDLGLQERDVPWWKRRIAKCFPGLDKLDCLQVKPHDNMSEEIRRDVLHFYY
ncbi:hypothetical protein V8D89_005785 [Ganoderma adspersum]